MKDFIDDAKIQSLLEEARNPDPAEIRGILAKARSKERLEPEETAKLLQVEDPELLEEIFQLAGELKKAIYGNRIVFLHLSISVINVSIIASIADLEVVTRPLKEQV